MFENDRDIYISIVTTSEHKIEFNVYIKFFNNHNFYIVHYILQDEIVQIIVSGIFAQVQDEIYTVSSILISQLTSFYINIVVLPGIE